MDIPDELKQALRKFRFGRRNSSSVMVVKIDKKSLKMVEDETYDNISMEELAEGVVYSTESFIIENMIQLECYIWRASWKRASIRGAIVRNQTRRWKDKLSARTRQLVADRLRDESSHLTRKCADWFPEYRAFF